MYLFGVRAYHQDKQVELQIKQTCNQEKQIQLQIEYRVDDRFKSAIELLGSDEMSVRVGGVYSLYYLALEEEKYRETIVRILYSHIRSKTGSENYKKAYGMLPSNEIQTVIDLLFKESGLYKSKYDELKENPKLTNSYLVGVDLKESDCRYVDFELSNLSNSNFKESNCNYSNFKNSNCKNSIFTKATLEGSILNEADFSGSECSFTNFTKCSVFNTNFENASFYDTKFYDVHCSLDAKYSSGISVNINSSIEKEAYKSHVKPISSMNPNGNYIINPSHVKYQT